MNKSATENIEKALEAPQPPKGGDKKKASSLSAPLGDAVRRGLFESGRGETRLKICESSDKQIYLTLKEKAKEMRNNPTEAEAFLWSYLKEKINKLVNQQGRFFLESTGTVLFDSNSINYKSKNLIKSNTVVL